MIQYMQIQIYISPQYQTLVTILYNAHEYFGSSIVLCVIAIKCYINFTDQVSINKYS